MSVLQDFDKQAYEEEVGVAEEQFDYQKAKAGAEAFGADAPEPPELVGQRIDPGAKFLERFEGDYKPEMDRNQLVDDQAEQYADFMGTMTRMDRLIGL